MSQMFGRYVLEKKLGAGGMGEVRLARQTGPDGFERPCVVKRMHRALSRDENLVKLFLDEARLTAGLTHPNIAQVYDFGKIEGAYYLAMERVSGVSVRELIGWHVGAERAVPLPIACRLVTQAARALDYAHSATSPTGAPLHIVHRDVSPANILVSEGGAVKLIDFGIATSAARSAQTRTGVVRGKAAYMSPEQMDSGALDGRSDLYSLGLVLFELIALERAVGGASDELLAQAVATPRFELMQERRPETPAPLVRIVERALERDPARRFQTGGDFAAALERLMATLGWAVTDAEVGALVRQVGSEVEVTAPGAIAEECPPDDLLERFSRGDVTSGDAEVVRAHLDGCPTCLELVAALAPQRESPAAASVAGERVGRYVIEEVLGTGGMGIVLKGKDPQLDRHVAVKLMLWDGSEERRTRFVRESQAAARVRHPNVVAVHDIGTHGDELFMAMELVQGPTLRHVLLKRPAAAEVVRLVRGIAEGLSAIHQVDLVHRDLKPENVLIDADGRPRITDFGVARAVGSELTRTGQVLGTLAYMAPEQIVGATVGPEADQFALCVIAYEAFTGSRPFAGESRAELNAAMKAGVVAKGWSAVPRPWRPVLARGLRFDPRERYPSVAALVAALRERGGVGPVGVAAAALLVMGLVAGAAWMLTTSRVEPPAPTPVPITAPVATAPAPVAPAPAAVEPAAVVAAPVEPTRPDPKRGEPKVLRGAKARGAKEHPAAVKTGQLSVNTTPSMEVSVDGRAVGSTPTSLTLSEGSHRVGLRAPAEGLSREERVAISSERPVELSWSPRRVELDVRSTPPDVEFEIAVDGRSVGETPLKSLTLWEGRRRLRVRSTSGWEHEQTVEIRPDQKLRLRLRDGEGLDVVPR